MSKLRCLVTGATGFIGSHLYKALQNHPQVESVIGTGRQGSIAITTDSIVSCNVGYEADVKYVMDRFKPDIIFHLAGYSKVKLIEDFSQCMRLNAIGTQNMLHYAPEGCKFVLASSATVYGCSGDGVSRETDKLSPSSVYATSKIAAENIVCNYSSLKGIRYQILRYVANVGPGATHGFLKDLIAKLKSDNPYLELLGKAPGSTKPYMHVSDTVNATIHLALSGKGLWNNIYNVSTDDNKNIEEIAQFVMRQLGIVKPIVWNEQGNWQGDDRWVNPSNFYLWNSDWKPKYQYSLEAIGAACKEMT